VNILKNLIPQFGRLSPQRVQELGHAINRSVGYIGVGPIVVLFNLPERFQVKVPPPLSIQEANQFMSLFEQELRKIFPPA
jgi:hypothetical protein